MYVAELRTLAPRLHPKEDNHQPPSPGGLYQKEENKMLEDAFCCDKCGSIFPSHENETIIHFECGEISLCIDCFKSLFGGAKHLKDVKPVIFWGALRRLKREKIEQLEQLGRFESIFTGVSRFNRYLKKEEI
jgi:hypothetical protein